ncbi:septation ring formation regulator EzrA [Mycobacterium intracellulare]|uniref:septation ring formation regulator EzrA n=1 Tax=Mycobacterium intracellulare TaxID=1767 RepID=UPI001CDA9457|nr:septation ring formation regulator EzrA [Mycobacterium intracellulare]MCA2253193.1 septation ring formation regulator EzrA [Mycobacterium intracellulare]
METLARLFLSSDYQCKTLLQSLVHRYASGDIGDELRSAMEQFAASVDLHRVLSEDPSYRQARDEIETLRKRLRHDVDAADQRDQELARLRRDSEELRRLRIRVAELESVVASAAYPLHQAGQHDVMLSRQQRRAAERAARKGRY